MRSRTLTALVLIATMLALSVTLWTSYQARQTAECQADVNISFLQTLKTRSEINDGDREASRRLVVAVLPARPSGEPPPTDEEEQAYEQNAVEIYNTKQKRLDELREANPLPSPSEINQC